MRKLIQYLYQTEKAILGVSMTVMLFLTVANVISRKIFNASFTFTEELTVRLFLLTALIGSAISAKEGTLVGLSLVTDFLPQKGQKIAAIIALISEVFFCLYLFYYSIDMVKTEYITKQVTPAMGWPEWIFGLTMPIGSCLLVIHLIEKFINMVLAKEEN